MERVAKIKQKLSNLDSRIQNRIMNTPGIEDFSIEEWERTLNM